MDKKLIAKAVKVHFACDNQMRCSDLEDSTEAARAFYLHLCGEESSAFNRLIKTNRYKNKLILVTRYINNKTQ